MQKAELKQFIIDTVKEHLGEHGDLTDEISKSLGARMTTFGKTLEKLTLEELRERFPCP